jgi:3-deoxy-D-manno-octulosonic-acid transferase
MHAASVGETLSILPVLTALRQRAKVLLTTGTVTSQVLLERRLIELGLAGDVLHRFAPLDVPAWIGRFLAHWRPDAACFVESELWPNQLAACQARRIPLMLVNARMSDRSFRQWQRVPWLAKSVLGCFATIQARGEQDADRLRRLGAGRVECHGDLKFSAPPLPYDQAEYDRLAAALADRPVWLAASTHPGEEAVVAAAHQSLAMTHPGLVTIVVPRHPDRGADLAAAFAAPRRSLGHPPPVSGLWIADTLGELGLWYRLAPVALVGNSLIAPGGGQNPLEPARLGCAIAVGPYCDNFADHVALLYGADALTRVEDAAGLAQFVASMLDDPQRWRRARENAAAVVQRHADLPDRTAETLLALLPPAAA